MSEDLIDILFLGDIVGKPGRTIASSFINKIRSGEIKYGTPKTIKSGQAPDFIIANVENASHGFGLTQKNHKELSTLGINAFTSGNHIWDRKEIFEYINESDRLIRPLNYPKEVPGVGSRIFKISDNISIGVINLLGRIFMNPIDSPWSCIEEEVKKIKEITPIIILDFHAEATAEKISMGHFANRLGISAVVGTHTHVQTADEKILDNKTINKKTAYITDAGFCGSSDGVIGMDVESSFKRLSTNLPERFEVITTPKTELNGVRLVIDAQTGCAQFIERINYNEFSSEDK